MTAGRGARTAQEPADARVITLRGELWRRHADLGQMDPADARYTEAVNVVLELTEQLLRAETESAETVRVSPPWLRWTILVVGPALVVASILLAATLPGLGSWWFRAVDAVVLGAVILTAMWALLRNRRPPGRGSDADAGTTAAGEAPVTGCEPETNPMTVVEPVEAAR